ncbi:MAG: hypothetical protein K2J93_05475 [Anaeroplasmataceae bacterium]|nr:hypothetical protein [Anaeroplasmataceae bacterium]
MCKKTSGIYDESVEDASLIGKKYSLSSESKVQTTFEHLSLSKDKIYKLRDDLMKKVEK